MIAHDGEGPQRQNYAFGNPDTEATENEIEVVFLKESKTASAISVPLW
jgi:hypothetical protein